jgi:hypothetical protein
MQNQSRNMSKQVSNERLDDRRVGLLIAIVLRERQAYDDDDDDYDDDDDAHVSNMSDQKAIGALLSHRPVMFPLDLILDMIRRST